VQYRYRLEGFDRNWIDAGTRRAAFYTNLPPGRYRFQVIAANNDGVWSATGPSFALRQLPHYYQTWWFYSLLALVAGTFGFLVYRWRVLQMEAQWGAVLRERGRIAREIHDTLAQGFVGISVQLEVVAQLLAKSAEAARGPLDQARASVRASLEEARASIWNLRSEAADGEDLPARLSRKCTRLAEGSSSRVYLQIKGTYRPLEPKIEEELLRIGQEAVANAVRHSSATRIAVQLIYLEAQVSLLVEDNGQGFVLSGSAPPGHYGIQGMRERSAEINATFRIQSSPGEGTRIFVNAPVQAAMEARR
jgi:signal transduction histidine kinase